MLLIHWINEVLINNYLHSESSFMFIVIQTITSQKNKNNFLAKNTTVKGFLVINSQRSTKKEPEQIQFVV